jgi:hypothetical protein
MAHEGLHEAADKLSAATLDSHRAIISMMEELEAVDWYQQRADATDDPTLRAILVHHLNEELEHFAMLLEHQRRRIPKLDEVLRTYLFKGGEITQIEHAAEQRGGTTAQAPAEGSLKNLTVGRLIDRSII